LTDPSSWLDTFHGTDCIEGYHGHVYFGPKPALGVHSRNRKMDSLNRGLRVHREIARSGRAIVLGGRCARRNYFVLKAPRPSLIERLTVT
jgi:hypothetical protein